MPAGSENIGPQVQISPSHIGKKRPCHRESVARKQQCVKIDAKWAEPECRLLPDARLGFSLESTIRESARAPDGCVRANGLLEFGRNAA